MSPHSHTGACDVHASGTIEQYFYGELTAAERQALDGHVADCAVCRDALAELEEIRAALASRPVVSAPPSGDWSSFMARLDAAIAEPSETGTGRPVVVPFTVRAPRRYVAYLATAALLALVTLGVLYAARWRTATVTPQTQSADITPAPAAGGDEDLKAIAALSEQHFERSKLVVLGLAAKDPRHTSGADWAYERRLASTLLSDTRLYRMAAEDRGMNAVAGVMRDLELVLLQASMTDDTDTASLEQLQRLIRKRDLLQKMNVVTTTGL